MKNTTNGYTLDCMALTSGDAEYSKRLTFDAYSLDDAIDMAIESDPSIYHISHAGRPVWSESGVDL